MADRQLNSNSVSSTEVILTIDEVLGVISNLVYSKSLYPILSTQYCEICLFVLLAFHKHKKANLTLFTDPTFRIQAFFLAP